MAAAVGAGHRLEAAGVFWHGAAAAAAALAHPKMGIWQTFSFFAHCAYTAHGLPKPEINTQKAGETPYSFKYCEWVFPSTPASV